MVGQTMETTPAWETFSSAEGNFTVLMPGTPKHEVQQAKTVMGAIDMHLYSQELRNNTAYIIIYNDYPSAIASTSPR